MRAVEPVFVSLELGQGRNGLGPNGTGLFGFFTALVRGMVGGLLLSAPLGFPLASSCCWSCSSHRRGAGSGDRGDFVIVSSSLASCESVLRWAPAIS